jgi:diguanylate cyclase (GGDEF)-like protein/PAS domain S-box-containing protein
MESRSDLLTPYRLRTVQIGVRMTLLTLVLLAAYPFIPGHGDLESGPYAFVVAAALFGAVLVALLPWRRLFEAGLGIWVFYIWSALDILLITVSIAANGGWSSELFYLYGLTTVFFSASYPPKGQAVLLGFTAACYMTLLAVIGSPIDPAVLALRFGVLSLICYMALFLSRELVHEMVGHGEAYEEAERRAGLLARVAAAISRSNALDPEQVLGAIADGVTELGMDFSGIAMLDDVDKTFRVLESRGLPDDHVRAVHPSDSGVVGLVLQAGRTITVEDYGNHPVATTPILKLGMRASIASPIWRQGRLTAVLAGGSRTRKAFSRQEIEAFELLAAQAGRALENAALTQELRQNEARFRSLVQYGSDVVSVIDAGGVQRYISPAITRVMGFTPEQSLGTNGFDSAHPDELEFVNARMDEMLAHHGKAVSFEARVRHADGGWYWHEVTATNLLNDPSVGGIVVNHRDITERKAFQEQLRRQAFHDALTGLDNRASFMLRLDQALTRARQQNTGIAVLLLDLDRFKNINDTLGHAAGDELLRAVSARLRATISEHSLLARLGGDEFTVMLEHVTDTDSAVQAAERIMAALGEPIHFLDGETLIGASIGIALSSEDTAGADELLARADLAMYEAKDRGRGRCALFDRAMSDRARERLEMEADLRLAIDRGEMELHYQPVVSLTDGDISGFEALVRWRHPRRGLTAPSDFIPLAEETGLILPLGRWVLEEACTQIQRWQCLSRAPRPLSIGVNVSARQFQQPYLADEVAEVLRRTGVDPRSLRLEITETVLIEDAEQAMVTLARLKQLGVTLVMDDFGTGYSSLSYIRRFPFDVLKIDKSFIDHIDSDPEAEALTRAIMHLGHTLNLVMIAEGIERCDQLRRLQALGCDLGQGFLFSQPLPPEAIPALLLSDMQHGVRLTG